MAKSGLAKTNASFLNKVHLVLKLEIPAGKPQGPWAPQGAGNGDALILWERTGPHGGPAHQEAAAVVYSRSGPQGGDSGQGPWTLGSRGCPEVSTGSAPSHIFNGNIWNLSLNSCPRFRSCVGLPVPALGLGFQSLSI